MRRSVLQRTVLLFSSLYLAALCVMIFVGHNFETLSAGLAAPTGNAPFYCRELLSSGGDDDVMIASFVLFWIPLFFRLIKFRRRPSRFELLIFSLCFCLVSIALWVATLDCANIFYTAFVIFDPYLASALIAFLMSALCFGWILSRDPSVSREN